MLVIAELLGVPASYAPSLRDWSQAIVRMYEVAPSAEVIDDAVRAATDFAGLVRELADERRSSPQDDLISDLVATSLSRGRGRGGRRTPAQRGARGVGERLRQRPRGDAAGADARPDADVALTVEEMLRFDSALQLFERTATEEVDRR